MIKCKERGCSREYCCIECNIHSGACICEIAQELDFDKERIIRECEYVEAVESNSGGQSYESGT